MDSITANAGQSAKGREPRLYDTSVGGHYGASAALAARGHAPGPEVYTGTWLNVSQGLHGNYRDILMTYWQQIIHHLETDTHDYKIHQLPLARIKKVMKADPEVKMISAEAPILFAKGCDIFITELTMRAWIHAEENKRRTLQRSDIASALCKSDMFDFLIDIVPREEAALQQAKRSAAQGSISSGPTVGASATAHSAQVVAGQQTNISRQTTQNRMAPQEYALAHSTVGNEQEYRQPAAALYGAQVSNDANNAYGQPSQQIFGEMYSYPPMAPQQLYQVNQRTHGTAPAPSQGNPYQRPDGAEGEDNTEGERHYGV